jgi:hypothetical protein
MPLFVKVLLTFNIALGSFAFSDGPEEKMSMPAPLPLQEDTSRFEVSPRVKKIDLIKTENLVRVIVRASAATECYKQREIERMFEKNVVKIILRLKKPQGQKECPNNVFDYEEKVYESPLDLAPKYLWILGYEGWHKMELH